MTCQTSVDGRGSEARTLPEGLGAEGAGWYVLNARDARWWQRDGLGRWADLEGDGDFPQLGMRIAVLQPGEPSGMYHAETGQEDFLVVSGECVLVIEGEERQLKAWDSSTVRRGPATRSSAQETGRASSSRSVRGRGTTRSSTPSTKWLRRTARASRKETPLPKEAYAPYPREPLFTPYREGDLPGD